MKTSKYFLRMIFLLVCIISIHNNILAQNDDDDDDDQPTTPKSVLIMPEPAVNNPKYDNRLLGEWWTDSKDAIFSKIIFGPKNEFVGYILASDNKTSLVGSYQIKDGEIYISATKYSPSLLAYRSAMKSFIFSTYSISDNKLQLITSDRTAAFNYYKATDKLNSVD